MALRTIYRAAKIARKARTARKMKNVGRLKRKGLSADQKMKLSLRKTKRKSSASSSARKAASPRKSVALPRVGKSKLKRNIRAAAGVAISGAAAKNISANQNRSRSGIRYKMTSARKAALKKAQMASARVRKRMGRSR